MSNKDNKHSFDFVEFLKDFTTLSESKHKQTLLMKLTITIAAIVIVCAFIFANRVVSTAMSKILVVNSNGTYMPVEADYKENLYETLLTTHCYSVSYYANSFDRQNIQTNQAKAIFLACQADMNAIFAKYTGDQSYADALNRGVVYRCEFQSINHIQLVNSSTEYKVIFTSVLSVIDGDKTTKFTILSKGTAIRITPHYPENPTGFYFKEYTQEYHPITTEN